jgi:hypothetical protein
MSDAKTLAPHQQRVVDEKEELDTRARALAAFFSSQTYAGLPSAERARLVRQLALQIELSNVLGERIAAFPG